MDNETRAVLRDVAIITGAIKACPRCGLRHIIADDVELFLMTVRAARAAGSREFASVTTAAARSVLLKAEGPCPRDSV